MDESGRRLLLGASSSVLKSVDLGCTFESSLDFLIMGDNGGRLGGFAQVPGMPQQLLSSTVIQSGVSADWSSTDFGDHWTMLGVNEPGEAFLALLIAPSAPSRVYAQGMRTDTAGVAEPLWARSDDGGGSWTLTRTATLLSLVGVHPSQPQIAFAGEPLSGIDGQMRLLRSEDGGDHFTAVAMLGAITSFAAKPNASEFWLGGASGLYHSLDEGKSFKRTMEEFASVTCLAWHGDALWVCGDHTPGLEGVWQVRGFVGEQVLTYRQVTENRTCGGGDADNVCKVPWLDWELELLSPYGRDAGAPDAGP